MRTDIHRPSVVIPADYDFVALECIKIEGIGDCHFIMAERAAIRRHMERTGGNYSAHQHGGNCHICGANAVYTVLFHHKPSNVYVRTGMDCADKLEWDSGAGEAFRAKCADWNTRRAGKQKAEGLLGSKGVGNAWTIFNSTEPDEFEENTIREMVGKLVQYGSLSDKQFDFIGRLLVRIVNRASIKAERAAETEAAKPVPVTDDRITIAGKVLSIRAPRNVYDIQVTRTLVQHADGWKVWGTLPAALDDVKIGDQVEFAAKIKPSDKDPKFGFFSRPTKARKLEVAA